jgi:hypothetical protein
MSKFFGIFSEIILLPRYEDFVLFNNQMLLKYIGYLCTSACVGLVQHWTIPVIFVISSAWS